MLTVIATMKSEFPMDNLAFDSNTENDVSDNGSTNHNTGNACTDDCHVSHIDTPNSDGQPTEGTIPEGEISHRSISWLHFLKKLRPSHGMLLALVGALFFTGVDVTVELATEEVEPFLVLSLYTTVIILLSLGSIIAQRIVPPRTAKPIGFLIVCGGCFAAGATFITLAISKMPVGDAVSIMNSLPIFVGAFGWIFLKQPLRIIDIFFSILCIVGVTLIARPTFIFSRNDALMDLDAHEEFIGALYAVGSAVSLALSFITGKVLQDLEVRLNYILLSNSSLTFVCNAIICSASGLWTAPSPPHYWAIAFAPGFLELFAQLAVFWAFKLERAVIVSIILTSEIIFTFALQILFIDITPHWYSAIGATCIIVTCVGMATRKDEPSGSVREAAA